MMTAELLLNPAIAFLIYMGLVGLLALTGRRLAGKTESSPLQASTYSSGERLSENGALPGYASTFIVALFFAVLHVGVLMLGSAGGSPGSGTLIAVIYLSGLGLTLLALVIG
jgi:NADH:ubiquinone oxidoreductase subunit 3 (subunit A)